jgi:hypothetical protein
VQGTVDDFDLRYVFRFLSLASKTGKLTVAGPSGSGRVFFRGGEIYHAESDLRREGFGRKLVRAGKLSEESLRATLGYCASQGKGLGDALVERGLVERADLESVLQEEIEEVVLGLFRNQAGKFSFIRDEEVESDTLILVPVEGLLEEDSESFASRVPLLDAGAARGGESGAQISVSADEWSVIASIDGRRTVRDIANRVGRSNFSVGRSLRRLVALGLVSIPGETPLAREQTPAEVEPARPPGRSAARREATPRVGPPPPPPPPPAVGSTRTAPPRR